MCTSLAMLVAVAPGPAPTWANRAIETAALLTLFGVATAVIVGHFEQTHDYREALADGLPARHPYWPTPLVVGAWFIGCSAVTWLVGQGIEQLDQAVLSPLLTALDPAKVDTPEVTDAISIIMGILVFALGAAVVANFALPLIAGYVHHRKIRAVEATYALEVDEYLNTHGDRQPTGAISAGSLSVRRGY